MRAAGLTLLALLAAGCAHPAYISCKGKGTVSGQSNMIVSFGGSSQFTLTLDCGDGLEYSQRAYAPRPPRPAPEPKQ
jgi:hypothetical protein